MQKRSENSSKMMDESKGSMGVGGHTKRRALGDITNKSSRADDSSKGHALKKHVVQAPSKETNTSNMHISEPIESTDGDSGMFETETRVYMNRPSDNIDARDAGNPLLVTEYVDVMYAHFKESEIVNQIDPNYMNENVQPHINEKMRAILIDWLVSTSIASLISCIIHILINMYVRCHIGRSSHEIQDGP